MIHDDDPVVLIATADVAALCRELIDALRDMRAEVEALKARVAALEARPSRDTTGLPPQQYPPRIIGWWPPASGETA